MIGRLKKRPRLDTLRTEKRQRKAGRGRWVYLALLAGLVLWLADLTIGRLVFFHAEGFVMRTRQEAAAPFTAKVASLHVSEGQAVDAGALLARLESPELARDLARLAIRIAELEAELTQVETRAVVLEEVLPFARKRADRAGAAIAELETDAGRKLVTSERLSSAAREEFQSQEELSRLGAEHASLKARLAQLGQALDQARGAYEAMRDQYADGRVEAPIAGTVATIPVSAGSVVRAGEPIVRILSGPSHVIAYTRPGAVFQVRAGQPVILRYGARTLDGVVEEMLPISAELPAEFQRAFRPRERAQMLRIGLPGEVPAPPLLTKVEVSSTAAPGAALVHAVTRYARALGQ